jgi:hypothetical protein
MNSQTHLTFILLFAATLFSVFHLSDSYDLNEDAPVQQTAILSSEQDPNVTPALYPFVSPAKEKPSLKTLVENQVKQMNNSTDSADLREEELQQAAKSLTDSDIQTLKGYLFDSTLESAQRSVSLYLLTHAGLATAGILYEFISTSYEQPKLMDPHANDFKARETEAGLRITALEGLDLMAVENAFAVAPLLENISANNPDSTLRFFADIALSGIDSGRPNKLSRYIDETLKEHGE